MKKIICICVVGVFLFSATSVLACVCEREAAATPGADKNVFFVHHSTGEIYWDGTINKGGMKKKLKKHGYDNPRAPWWDGDTDPKDLPDLIADKDSWEIFDDADIIIFKSCYPASAIGSKKKYKNYKKYYREMYDTFEAYPDVMFVPMSTPPLPKKMTNKKEARYAIKFDKWLANKYLDNYSGNNLAPFQLHKLLDNKNGYLKSKYVVDPYDGHPANTSGVAVGKAIWKHLDNALGI